jgi:hypothetical protein
LHGSGGVDYSGLSDYEAEDCSNEPLLYEPETVALTAGKVASSVMTDQSLSEQAREAILRAIIKSAPTVGNSPAGVRDLAEAYALLERNLVPNAGVVQTRT